MFTDEKRSRVSDELRRQDNRLFAHILTPDLFFQAARLCGLGIVCSPLNLINLVWLAVSAARHPEESFAALLGLPLKTLRDHENFSSSGLATFLHDAEQPCRPKARRRRKSRRGATTRRRRPSRHDPRAGKPERVSEQAFAQARQRMPSEFWMALFILLDEQFERLYGDVIRWQRFRLLAVDGTRLDLPDYPALRQHFGTATNAFGGHNAQAQLVLVQFPLARLPYAYALEPVRLGEVSLARRLLQGLRGADLVLLDAGYLSYGLLVQIQQQQAHFVVRLHQRLNVRTLKKLGSSNDKLVCWQPKDSRGQWRQEGLPRSLVLRLLTYKVRGYRPLRLLTNVVSEQEVSAEQFWGLSVSEEGEVLSKGIYNWRWEIETTYRELKVEQQLEGGLRSRTPEGIAYEVAGHVLYYLLVRWLLVEAAVPAGLSPLQLSFTEALREIKAKWPTALTASAKWLSEGLRPRLREALAGHVVAERPCRHYPRSKKARKTSKRAADRRAKKRKQSRPEKAKERPWYGQGWDLSGPKPPPAASGQG
jgi:Transposase DDE domain